MHLDIHLCVFSVIKSNSIECAWFSFIPPQGRHMLNTEAFTILITLSLCDYHVGQRAGVIIACTIKIYIQEIRYNKIIFQPTQWCLVQFRSYILRGTSVNCTVLNNYLVRPQGAGFERGKKWERDTAELLSATWAVCSVYTGLPHGLQTSMTTGH